MRTAFLASVLTALACASGVHAAEGAPVEVSPGAQSFHVGDLHLWALRDTELAVDNDGKIFGVGVGSDAVAQVLQPAGAPTEHISFSDNVLLLSVGKLVVLFDTGIGPGRRGVMLKSLQQAGVAPEEVTDILITHPHMDHVGGLVTAHGAPQFPDAVVRMSAAAWTWLQHKTPQLAKAITQQVRTFAPGEELVPGVVRSVSLAGHAPGHVGYEIISGRARLLDIGDIAHSSVVSLAKPQWPNGFDEDRKVAKATRLAKLTQLANSHERVFAPHFPFPGIGHIVAEGEGFAWKADSP